MQLVTPKNRWLVRLKFLIATGKLYQYLAGANVKPWYSMWVCETYLDFLWCLEDFSTERSLLGPLEPPEPLPPSRLCSRSLAGYFLRLSMSRRRSPPSYFLPSWGNKTSAGSLVKGDFTRDMCTYLSENSFKTLAAHHINIIDLSHHILFANVADVEQQGEQVTYQY